MERSILVGSDNVCMPGVPGGFNNRSDPAGVAGVAD